MAQHIIAIASQKGGTGKTTTAVSLAAGLGRQGQRVLLIDVDSQANASKVLLPHYADIARDDTVYTTILGRQPLPRHVSTLTGVDVVPAHTLLSNTDSELTTARDHREARLKQGVDAVQTSYDVILIDCPPALSWLTLNAFTAASHVLVVVSPGYFELDSVVQLGRTIDETREFFNPDLTVLGYLFTMADQTVNTATSLKLLRQAYPEEVLRTVIPRNVDIRDAHFNKQDIFRFNPRCKAALAYQRLIEELFDAEAPERRRRAQ